MRRETPQRLARQLARGRPLAVRGELLTHAFGPELSDVIGNAGNGILPNRFRAEEVSDVIRHLHQVLGATVLSGMLRIAAHGGKGLFGNEDIGALQQ